MSQTEGDDAAPAQTLAWGETPFTHMDREELERHAQRMHAALTSARSVLSMYTKGAMSGNAFWGGTGVGGKAHREATEALALADYGYESDNIYRAFFRYARCLLFSVDHEGFTPWRVCPVCGTMLSSSWEKDNLGSVCGSLLPHAKKGEPQCGGVMRELLWSDLEPKKEAGDEQV